MSQHSVARTAALSGGLAVRPRMSKPPGEAPRPASSRRPGTPRPDPGRPRGGPAGGLGPGGGAGGVGPLTGLGVALVLVVASALGALLDLFLVGGPAWALAALYVAACGYTAGRVRPADRFAALVAPPLAFAAAIVLLAVLMPETFGSGPLGLAATAFELLAGKAKALYCGAALSAVVLLVRRTKARRNAWPASGGDGAAGRPRPTA